MESEKVKILDNANFEDIINKGVSLVDFWAEWCGPCRMQGPIIEKLAEKLGDKLNICKLNVDVSAAISQKYNITSIPTIIFYKDGLVIKKLVGLQDENALQSAINKIL